MEFEKVFPFEITLTQLSEPDLYQMEYISERFIFAEENQCVNDGLKKVKTPKHFRMKKNKKTGKITLEEI